MMKRMTKRLLSHFFIAIVLGMAVGEFMLLAVLNNDSIICIIYGVLGIISFVTYVLNIILMCKIADEK